MQASAEIRVDVAIVGGGLAGNLLARQLHRRRADLRILIVEKSTETDYKVGESTVEIATDYLVRRHGLASYLYDQHLPKNGLRFFFDNADKNASLFELSELGTDALPVVPSFQLDRKRLESDLLRWNRESGVQILTGAACRDLQLGTTGEKHRFVAVTGNETVAVEADWVIDCSGRAQVISKQRKLKRPVEDHLITAAWGRFTGVGDLDAMETEQAHEWRRRVRYTPRSLSTNHFCYDGYWIWFIPLGRGVTSVGVVCERDKWSDSWRGESGFVSFVNEHRAARELLSGAKMVDFGSYKQLAFATSQFFSEERWAVIGDAAAFTDPFYSPGSDFISIENDFVTELICREQTEGRETWLDRLKTYEAFMHHRFETTMLLYQDQYHFFGSYELMRMKLLFDISGYYNQWLRQYMVDEHLNVSSLKAALANAETITAIMRQYKKLFDKVDAELRRRGDYHRLNLGDFGAFTPLLPFVNEMGLPIDSDQVDKHTAWIFSTVRSWGRMIMKEEGPRTCAELAALL